MERFINDWFTRPKPLIFLAQLLLLFVPWFNFLYACLAPMVALNDATSGTLKTLRVLPLSLERKATAYWLIGVIYLPLALISLYTFQDAVGWPLAIQTAVPAWWHPHRYLMVLGSAGLLYLTSALRLPGASTNLIYLGVLALNFALDYYVRELPAPPFYVAAWILGLGIPASALLRVWVLRRLLDLGGQPERGKGSGAGSALIERIYSGGLTGITLLRIPAMFGMMALAVFVMYFTFEVLHHRVFNSSAATEGGGGPEYSNSIITVLLMSQAGMGLHVFWPSLKVFRSLPLSATRLAFWLLGSHMLYSMAILAIMALMVYLASPEKGVHSVGQGLYLSLILAWSIPFTLRWSHWPATLALLACLLPSYVALFTMLSVSPYTIGLLVSILLLACALIPNFYWTRSLLRRNSENYQLAKWQQYVRRKG